MTTTNNTRSGWTRVISNGEYSFINDETGTKFDTQGFDYWGFNAQGRDILVEIDFVGWSRILVNGKYTFIHSETGTKFDANGFDYYGYNAQGTDFLAA